MPKGAAKNPPKKQREAYLHREVGRPVEYPLHLPYIDGVAKVASKLGDESEHPKGCQGHPPSAKNLVCKENQRDSRSRAPHMFRRKSLHTVCKHRASLLMTHRIYFALAPRGVREIRGRVRHPRRDFRTSSVGIEWDHLFSACVRAINSR